jgi:hypothetical protein
MSHTQVYRSGNARALAAVTVAVCVGVLGTLAARRDGGDVLRFGPSLALAAWLVWLAYWRPRVVVDDEGVTLHNIFRTVHVPWSSVVELHSRYGLRVDTTFGSYAAWAVPAPAGRERLRGGDTEASLMARQRLEKLRALGLLAQGAEPEQPTVTWSLPAIAAAGVLVALAVAGPLVAG